MAISGPSGGGDGGDPTSEDGVFSEINITPLTDIFLVLLIIFMVTSSVIVNSGSGVKSGLKITLPQGSAADVSATDKDLVIAVLSDGRFVLAGDVVDRSALEATLKSTHDAHPNTQVVVQADEGVPHGKVVEVIELAKAAGLAQIVIGIRQDAKN